MINKNKKEKQKEIKIKKKDLPLSCPIKQTWNGHPKIYLYLSEANDVMCPYCGLKYKLVIN